MPLLHPSRCLQAYIVLLLYAPIAYPLSILILAAAVLGVGSIFTVALFWGQFWSSVGEVRPIACNFVCHSWVGRLLSVSAWPLEMCREGGKRAMHFIPSQALDCRTSPCCSTSFLRR